MFCKSFLVGYSHRFPSCRFHKENDNGSKTPNNERKNQNQKKKMPSSAHLLSPQTRSRMRRHLADFPSEYGSSPRMDSYFGSVVTTTSHPAAQPPRDSFYSPPSVVSRGFGNNNTTSHTPNHHNNNSVVTPMRAYQSSTPTTTNNNNDFTALGSTQKELEFYQRRCEALLDVTLEYRQVIDKLQRNKQGMNAATIPLATAAAASSASPQGQQPPPVPSAAKANSAVEAAPPLQAAAAESPRQLPDQSPQLLEWFATAQQSLVESTTAKVELWCLTATAHTKPAGAPANLQDNVLSDIGQQCAVILDTIDKVLPPQ